MPILYIFSSRNHHPGTSIADLIILNHLTKKENSRFGPRPSGPPQRNPNRVGEMTRRWGKRRSLGWSRGAGTSGPLPAHVNSPPSKKILSRRFFFYMIKSYKIYRRMKGPWGDEEFC